VALVQEEFRGQVAQGLAAANKRFIDVQAIDMVKDDRNDVFDYIEFGFGKVLYILSTVPASSTLFACRPYKRGSTMTLLRWSFVMIRCPQSMSLDSLSRLDTAGWYN
jgi:hypothetical protein